MPALRSRLHMVLRQVRCDRCVCHPVVDGVLTSGTNQIGVWLYVCVCVSVCVGGDSHVRECVESTTA